MERTFSRESWTSAQEAWRDGDFSDEWKPWRHRAAMRGMIHPPEGTKWDAWDEDDPSQRSIIVRAMRETPTLLGMAIDARKSWAGVVQYLVRERDELRREYRPEPPPDGPDPREATVALKQILERITNS